MYTVHEMAIMLLGFCLTEYLYMYMYHIENTPHLVVL